MRLLTTQQIETAFCNHETHDGTFWAIIGIAKRDAGIEVRQALEILRFNRIDLAIFIEKILQPGDIDDVDYVIDLLERQMTEVSWLDKLCLILLQAWRARSLMQIVIDKRNAMQQQKTFTDTTSCG